MARTPTTSAAATANVTRSSWNDRLAERWRIFSQGSVDTTRMEEVTAPVLRHDAVLFPECHVTLKPSRLLPLFHRPESLHGEPLVVVVPHDESQAATALPVLATLGRVFFKGDDESATIIAQHRVTIAALPDGPRDLVSMRHEPLASKVVPDELGGPLRDAARPLLKKLWTSGWDEEDANRTVERWLRQPTLELAYSVVAAMTLPLARQKTILRIDDAATLVDIATAAALNELAKAETT